MLVRRGQKDYKAPKAPIRAYQGNNTQYLEVGAMSANLLQVGVVLHSSKEKDQENEKEKDIEREMYLFSYLIIINNNITLYYYYYHFVECRN